MIINFEHYGQFYAVLNSDANSLSYERVNGYSLKECADFIEYKMTQNPKITDASICDNNTGEVIATILRDEEETEDYEPDYDECGYNPYMGCYDFDC
jgi:hypothetical protein